MASRGRYSLGGVIAWEIFRWVNASVSWIPGVIGVWVRWLVLSVALRRTAGPFRVLEGVIIEFPRRLSIGRHVGVNYGAWINARGGVTIGDDSIIGPYAVIHSANHATSDATRPVRVQGYEPAEVSIGRNVWIGAHATVLPGVTVGDDAVVGAGAVVTADVAPGDVVGGVPARVIRSREADLSGPPPGSGDDEGARSSG